MPKVAERPSNPYPMVRFPGLREFPLSAGQELLLTQQDHVTGGWLLTGPLDRTAVSAAIDGLLRRHDILRTRFVSRPDDSPVQQVMDDVTVPIDWAGDDWRAAVGRSVLEPFELSRPPLFRLVAGRLEDGQQILFLAMHHIVTDRWSMDVLARDLFELYAAALGNREARLPDLAVQYGDYARWQREFLDSTAIRPQLDYWRRTLADGERLRLPAAHRRTGNPGTADHEMAFELPAEATSAMTLMAWRSRASPAMVVTAALGGALRTFTGQHGLVIGALVCDRSRPELQQVLGPFINVVALRIDLSGRGLTFRELVSRTRDAWMAAYANQDVPFRQVMTARTHAEPGRRPVFDVLVNHGGGWPEASQHAGMPPQWDPGIPATATFELSLCTLMLSTVMAGDRLRVAFVYSPSRFDAATIGPLCSSYVELLQRGVAAPDEPLAGQP
jgi:hypothetical protein